MYTCFCYSSFAPIYYLQFQPTQILFSFAFFSSLSPAKWFTDLPSLLHWTMHSVHNWGDLLIHDKDGVNSHCQNMQIDEITLNARWSSYWECFLYFLSPTPPSLSAMLGNTENIRKSFLPLLSSWKGHTP